MKVTVYLFSHVRHQLGQDALELDLAEGCRSDEVESLVRAKLPPTFREQPFRLALNHSFLTDAEVLHEGDELAILPPMQGG